MNSQKASIIDAGDCIEYGSYSLASYFLDGDTTNSAHHRFCHIQVTDPDKRITCKESKKKKQVKEKEKPKEEENFFKSVEEY